MAKNIYLTLSGGAAKGLVHIYTIQKLIDLGFNIKAISGASCGSIIAGLYASGLSPKEIEDIFKSPKFKNIISRKLRSFNFNFFNPLNKSIGLFKTDSFLSFLNEVLENKSFSDCKIPFSVSQTNIEEGKIEYVKKGNLATEIIKSMTFPIMFESIDGLHYDGGILENLSIDYDIFSDKKIPIVGVVVQSEIKKDVNYNKSMFSLLKRIFLDVMWRHIYDMDISEANFIINIPADFDFFDFDKLDEAKELVDVWFNNNKKLLMGIKKFIDNESF